MDVIALDVSNGRSFCVLYQENKCRFEGEIKHNKKGFKQILQLVESCHSAPEIVFEATGVYSRVIERFCQNNNFRYYLMNPLEARKQTDSLRVNKTDISDAHKLDKPIIFTKESQQIILPLNTKKCVNYHVGMNPMNRK